MLYAIRSYEQSPRNSAWLRANSSTLGLINYFVVVLGRLYDT